MVLLDTLADRLVVPTEELFSHGEPDCLAAATLQVLHRDLVPLSVLEPWVARIATHAGVRAAYDGRDPFLVRGNAQAFLRALYLQLALGAQPPPVRALSSLPEMRSAHRVYERFGFVAVPERDWQPAPGVALRAFRVTL